jgi:hypothetical protein
VKTVIILAKNEIKARARLSRGLVNILKDDIDMLNIDADDFNIYTINESIKEARDTLNDMMANLDELEYVIIRLMERM